MVTELKLLLTGAIGDASAGDDRLAKTASLQDAAVSRSRASGAAACQLDLEGNLDSSIGQQRLRSTQIRPHQLALYRVASSGVISSSRTKIASVPAGLLSVP
jgi:hypothetical protein